MHQHSPADDSLDPAHVTGLRAAATELRDLARTVRAAARTRGTGGTAEPDLADAARRLEAIADWLGGSTHAGD